MRFVIALVCLLPITAPAADRSEIRDETGKKIGEIRRNNFLHRFDIHDPTTGRRTGTIERNRFNNRYEIKDSLGRKAGTIEKLR